MQGSNKISNVYALFNYLYFIIYTTLHYMLLLDKTANQIISDTWKCHKELQTHIQPHRFFLFFNIFIVYGRLIGYQRDGHVIKLSLPHI